MCGDGIDQNCDGSDELCPEDVDNDGDGLTENQGDCNDADPAIKPGATEVCGDDIDQDCDGSDLTCENVIADAGPDQTVTEGDPLTLDGSNSFIPDGSNASLPLDSNVRAYSYYVRGRYIDTEFYRSRICF